MSDLASGFGFLAPRRLVRLIGADALNISRDPMLVFAALMSVAPAIAFYFAREPMNAYAAATFGIVEFSRYFAPIALVIPAALVGWVTGFLLLEDRDDGLLAALDVTPIGKVGFLSYRAAITALVAAAITVLGVQLVVPSLGFSEKLLIVAIIAADLVLASVALPALARNKVEGLALTKLTNIAAVVPLLAAVPSPLRYVAGIVPTYWIGELLSLSDSWQMPLAGIAALAVISHAACGLLLFRILARRIE